MSNTPARELSAYIQHGACFTQGPFHTELVEVKREPMLHHVLFLTWTATGYGSKIPSEYMVRYFNGRGFRWYRVYTMIYSNVGTNYIIVRGEKLIVQLCD